MQNSIDILHPFLNLRKDPKTYLKDALKAYRDSLVDKNDAFKTIEEVWDELIVEEIQNS